MAAPMKELSSSTRLVKSLADCIYTPFFCEENVWKICEHVRDRLPGELDNCQVVYISNENRAIPLWSQNASNTPEQPVVWDYHVILLHQSNGGTMVYDLDSRLPFPCTFDIYKQQTIHSEEILKAEYHRYFRVLSAEMYLRQFASNRRHMLSETGDWQKTPPDYPCIHTPESTNNIDDFISMDSSVGWGSVLNHADFIHRFHPL